MSDSDTRKELLAAKIRIDELTEDLAAARVEVERLRGGVMIYLDPQPPEGITYMLGNESWLPPEKRSPRRLHVEEWGNLGPMELRPDVRANAAGFRVRSTDIPAPTQTATARQDDSGQWYWEECEEPEEPQKDKDGWPMVFTIDEWERLNGLPDIDEEER